MFTGIVTGIGRVIARESRRGGARLGVQPSRGFGTFRRGESVCVSGVCLTVLSPGRLFVADLSEETLQRSTLGEVAPGHEVNLERALAWGDRLSGHFVLGHVDAVTRLVQVREAGNSWTYRFTIPRGLSRYVVTKGSAAVDGVSLTVSARRSGSFDVAVIPETRRRTTLGDAGPGKRCNFEVDVFARYGASGWRRRILRGSR
jgi:riboflavin synthase